MQNHVNTDELDLICQEGVYPYEYVYNKSDIKELRLTPTIAFPSTFRSSGILKTLARQACM
jgi:hypothetical protein